MTTTRAADEFAAELTIRRRDTPAEGVALLELAHADGGELPAWQPGAHIDLILSDGLTRQYSLCGDPNDAAVWRIGVLLEADGRGGSRHVHAHLHPGATVRVRGPRNHFPLETAPRYYFVAGGIGITPIAPMVAAAQRHGRDWTLLYGGRTRASMAFASELAQRYPDRVTIWPQDERGLLDLDTLLAEPDDATLIYCCGPEPLLAAIEAGCASWPVEALHVERFAAKAAATDSGQAVDRVEVVCQQSGITVEVESDTSILEALEDADVPIVGSCYEGVCGTCETRVLEGTPDHRDSILSAAEKAAGEVMMVCVSRSRSATLVLDV